jgi:MarR family transcriptional regulator, organic hydroperoxide resistance regulator
LDGSGHGLDGSDHGPVRPFLTDLLACASHVLTHGFAEVLHQHGVSLPVWRVMAALHARPGATVSRLAEACLLQQPTMTKLLDRMVREGLVTRTPDTQDRRIVRVALAAEGQARAAELAAAAARYEAKILAIYPQAEEIKSVLRDIIARSGPALRHAPDGGYSRDEENA